MLVSLIAVCLMVAVEGSFSTYNHMEYYPSGYPMNGRHSESHVMHRDNYYNGPSSYHQAQYNGMQSNMRTEFSHFDYPTGQMMRHMYSSDYPMEMNSMYRNFDNQFYRNSGSFMSVYPMEMNSMYRNFDNHFNRFPGSYMSSYGQY